MRPAFLEARLGDEISYPAAEVKAGSHFQSAVFFGAHGKWLGSQRWALVTGAGERAIFISRS